AMRTCVGCKERTVKSSLLRLVAAGDVIQPDPRARMPGRGAYLHPSQACLELARRRRAFPRALRAPGPPSLRPTAEDLCGGTIPGITLLAAEQPGWAAGFNARRNTCRKAGREADERSMSTRR